MSTSEVPARPTNLSPDEVASTLRQIQQTRPVEAKRGSERRKLQVNNQRRQLREAA